MRLRLLRQTTKLDRRREWSRSLRERQETFDALSGDVNTWPPGKPEQTRWYRGQLWRWRDDATVSRGGYWGHQLTRAEMARL